MIESVEKRSEQNYFFVLKVGCSFDFMIESVEKRSEKS
jgi:hypothetical protein